MKLSEKLVDVSSKTKSLRDTKISGRVKGGPVKGRKIRITAYNTSNNNKRYKSYTVKLSSKGRFSKTFEPPVGGVWRLTATIARKGRVKAATRSIHLDAFHWTFVHEFYNKSGQLNRPATTTGVQHRVGLSDPWKVAGKRFFFSSFYVAGGNTAVVDIRGYKCKKITFRVGVEDGSEATAGTYKISQPSGTNPERIIKAGTMKRGEPAFEAFHSRTIRDRLLPNRPLEFRSYTAANGEDIAFLFGTAKVFCTFPSIN